MQERKGVCKLVLCATILFTCTACDTTPTTPANKCDPTLGKTITLTQGNYLYIQNSGLLKVEIIGQSIIEEEGPIAAISGLSDFTGLVHPGDALVVTDNLDAHITHQVGCVKEITVTKPELSLKIVLYDVPITNRVPFTLPGEET